MVCNAGSCVPTCQPGATQCASASTVQTCQSTGVYGAAWSCATGSCSGGACDGQTTTGTSCAALDGGLGSACGAAHDSCCTSIDVAGGPYFRAYDPVVDGGIQTVGDGGATDLGDPASVSGFRLDKYEVDVGRFRQFVTAWNGGWTPTSGSGKHVHLNGGLGLLDTAPAADAGSPYELGWDPSYDTSVTPTGVELGCSSAATWTPNPASNENLSMNCVNWYEAYAFCIWDGGFLPSEWEWEYAAAGGAEQREYPWGSAAPGTTSTYAIYGCDYPSASGTCSGTTINIAPVGTATLGAGAWGQLDLGGNVWEWGLDAQEGYAYPCIDCASVAWTGTPNHVYRGGAYQSPGPDDLSPPVRSGDGPAKRQSAVGFRCARTP
jgi:formylglycine-generating enzyme required for sulfatase activity